MTRANPLARGWIYLAAWFDAAIDERADPKIQLEQAIHEAQRQHGALTHQAAVVIGGERQFKMQLERQLARIDMLLDQARQALLLAEAARGAEDEVRAAELEQAAQAVAEELIVAESRVEELTALHDQSAQACAQARTAVRMNSTMLREKLADRINLLAQLEQAKMHEAAAVSLQQMNDMTAPTNIPTLDEVRDKIERRYAVALGQAELARDCTDTRLFEVQCATADAKATARLDEVRASLANDARPAVPGAASG